MTEKERAQAIRKEKAKRKRIDQKKENAERKEAEKKKANQEEAQSYRKAISYTFKRFFVFLFIIFVWGYFADLRREEWIKNNPETAMRTGIVLGVYKSKSRKSFYYHTWIKGKKHKMSGSYFSYRMLDLKEGDTFLVEYYTGNPMWVKDFHPYPKNEKER